MSEYFSKVQANKDKFYLKYMIIIDNRTAHVNYSISTNLHMDFGCTNELYSSLFTTKKGKVNKALSQYKKATGKKIRLNGTDNSSTYTRLVYELY